MGCHTWMKTKSKYSIEDIRQLWVEQQQDWVNKWATYTIDKDHEDRKKGGAFDHLSQEDFERHLLIYERQLRMVKNGNIKSAFVNHLHKDTDEGELYLVHNGVVYCETKDTPSNIFRVGNYPDDILLSMEDTMRFIMENKERIYYYSDKFESVIKELEEFWENNPIGLIEFG